MHPKCCRVCEATDNLQWIFTGGNEETLNMLRSISSSPITMNDNLPQHICLQCSVGLNEIYKFKSLYAITSAKKKNMLLSKKHLTKFRPDMDELKDQISITKKLNNSESDCSLNNERDDESEMKSDSEQEIPDLLNKYKYEVIWEEEKYAENNEGGYFERMSDHPDHKGESNDEVQTMMTKPVTDSNKQSTTDEKCGEECNTKIDLICDKQTSLQRLNAGRIRKWFPKSSDSERNEGTDTSSNNDKTEVSLVISEAAPSFELHEVFISESLSKKHGKIKPKEAKEGRHKTLHSNSQSNKCGQCDKSFSTLYSLKRHIALHSRPVRSECDECGKSFRTVSHLEQHKKIHSGFVECDECGKSFTSSRNLKVHRTLHSNPDRYKCETCGKAFSHPFTLKQHKAIHSNPDRYMCNACGKYFTSSYGLRYHLKTSHGFAKCGKCGQSHLDWLSNPDLNNCDECEKSFTTESVLKVHKCDECGKSFTRYQNLQIHQALHSNPDRFKCDLCGKAFTHPFSLKQHKASHSNPDKYRKSLESNLNKCDQCGKSFARLYCLKRHLALHSNPGSSKYDHGTKDHILS